MEDPMESSGEENFVEESHKLVDSLDKLRVSAESSSSHFKKKPVIIIVVGMAGTHCFSYNNYKEVIKQYILGPNGGIMTSLNLFATKFDKTRLPLVLAFNKTDVVDHKFALENLYRNIRYVGVSAITGAGMDDFSKAIEASAEEYMGTSSVSKFHAYDLCFCSPELILTRERRRRSSCKKSEGKRK
ncbi:unnamed protein product [Eruca vesicaria subsp. sativa]|uniref:GPN-loop GTPase n=1 Tax=Eruca vesicaria subsp. sativa TaxID=29727 RepID=A0ABC8K141_ERUVS|nr:unnamed protein product [Eruca vesicaria subsp. sativa]